MPEDSNINYSQGYDYLKIEQHSSYYNISLSHVPEEQKYLKVIPSSQDGDNSIKLETTNGREYFVKLKELEMNDCGELVMTLKPAAQELFSVVNKNSELFLNNSHLTLTNNLIADNLDNQQEQPLQHGFIKINAALSGILKNLQHKIE